MWKNFRQNYELEIHMLYHDKATIVGKNLPTVEIQEAHECTFDK